MQFDAQTRMNLEKSLGRIDSFHIMQQNNPLSDDQNLPLPHLMPIPSSAPWNLNAMPWPLASTSVEQPGGIMQFSAATINAADAIQHRLGLHQKRKSDEPMTIPQPVKQFISEEKITAHFNGLHISSDYIQHTNANNIVGVGIGDCDASTITTITGKNFTNLTYEDYQVTAKELAEKLKNASRITLCDEIKQLHEEQKRLSFLPETLLGHTTKPCTALMLWQPPQPIRGTFENYTDAESNNKFGHAIANQYIDENIVDDIEETEDEVVDAEIDDFIDNNNTCTVDFNNTKSDNMDEDF